MEIVGGLSGIWLLELALSSNKNFDTLSFLAFFVILNNRIPDKPQALSLKSMILEGFPE